MNREAEEFRISSDIKQANLEMVQRRLEQAESLLKDISETLRSDRKIESANFIDAFLSSRQDAEARNDAILRKFAAWVDDEYPEQAEGAQGEWEAGWRCFHCNEHFTNEEQAAQHFGTTIFQHPACQIDVAEYRAMEQRMHRYNDEDADIHRAMYRMQTEHQQALRREEEKGYARGLKDAAALAQPSPALELEKQEPVAWMDDRGALHTTLESASFRGKPVTPLYSAPVAQAGQVLDGMRLVPFNPTQDQWGGLARAIVFWMRSYPSNKHTPATLVEFITSLGHEVPEWMGDEAELRAKEHVISKGTIAVLIYKAMIAAAPDQGGE